MNSAFKRIQAPNSSSLDSSVSTSIRREEFGAKIGLNTGFISRRFIPLKWIIRLRRVIRLQYKFGHFCGLRWLKDFFLTGYFIEVGNKCNLESQFENGSDCAFIMRLLFRVSSNRAIHLYVMLTVKPDQTAKIL